jgi:predicted MFS family arabinose efflux permease
MNATVDNIRAIDSSVVTTEKPAWSAVFSLAMCITGLITAELLPISLLTPMAKILHITEGSAGQAVTVTAIVGLFASLFSAVITRRVDRRIVILSFSVILILSSFLVAFAPNYTALLIGRFLLGIGVGGFWSMAAAVAMRLVPEAFVPKAFSIIFGAGSIATAIAAPFGSYLGNVIGWRATFVVAAALGIVALVWQLIALPFLPPNAQSRLRTLFDVLRRPKIGLGILSVLLVFAGHFAFFTYLRPFLETQTHISVNGVSVILLLFGLAGFVGNTVAGALLGEKMRLVLIAAPLLLIGLGVALIMMGTNIWAAAILIAIWGVAFGSVPVAWSTWVARMVPDEAESGGALLVASIQLAITIGAAIGGLLLDRFKVQGSLTGGTILLFIATLIIITGLKTTSSKKSMQA